MGLHPEFRGGLGILRHLKKSSGARNQQERDTVEVKKKRRWATGDIRPLVLV